MRSFFRGFFVDPELERQAKETLKEGQAAAAEARAAAKQIKRTAIASTALVAVAGIGLVGLGAFLATEEGSRFARSAAQGITDELTRRIQERRTR